MASEKHREEQRLGYKKDGQAIGTDDSLKFQMDARAADALFCERMQDAIAQGLEHCPVGIDTNPGTTAPVFMGNKPMPFSLDGSPAALCAAN